MELRLETGGSKKMRERKNGNHNIPFEMMLISRIACQSAHGNRFAGWLRSMKI